MRGKTTVYKPYYESVPTISVFGKRYGMGLIAEFVA